jgi:hypothetical protein
MQFEEFNTMNYMYPGNELSSLRPYTSEKDLALTRLVIPRETGF